MAKIVTDHLLLESLKSIRETSFDYVEINPDIWVYLDVIERRFTDAFQALEKKVVSNDLSHLQHLAARVALRVLAGEPESGRYAGAEATPRPEDRQRGQTGGS